MLTIVVGCHNQEKWLAEAVYSAQNQIVPWYVTRNATLPEYKVVVSHDHCGGKGIGAAMHRNSVIAELEGWVIWLDADDLLPSNFVYEMTVQADRDGAGTFDLVTTPQQFITGARLDVFGPLQLWRCPPSLVDAVSIKGASYLRKQYPMHISTMFHKELWERTLGFDISLETSEDLDFWFRARAVGGNLLVAYATQLLRRQVKPLPLSQDRTQEEIQATLARYQRRYDHFLNNYDVKLMSGILPYEIPSMDFAATHDQGII